MKRISYRSKVVTPLAYTVRLINHKTIQHLTTMQALQRMQQSCTDAQLLRCHVQQFGGGTLQVQIEIDALLFGCCQVGR